jgi:hypothetical protein
MTNSPNLVSLNWYYSFLIRLIRVKYGIDMQNTEGPPFPIPNPNPTVHTDVCPKAKPVSTAKNAVLL